MSFLFGKYENLLELPDISKWDSANAENMKGLFSNCHSLISLTLTKKGEKELAYKLSIPKSEIKNIKIKMTIGIITIIFFTSNIILK